MVQPTVTFSPAQIEAMPPLETLVRLFGALEFQQPFSKEAFVSLAERFPDLLMERDNDGKILILSPVKKGSGRRESSLHGLLFMWNYQHQLGELFSPSTGFDLPSGATKSPDATWVSNETSSSTDDEELFVKTVPDFIAEVRTSSDRLKKLQENMTDIWMANGVRLAWLIDPYEETTHIYRQGQAVETIQGFDGNSLFGEEVMPGFELPLKEMKRR
ncbi:MAG: Uma2 family endonuclease [Saprospiraceae bacterium]|nr:Uma2 family endonuclease [Saprospiraceae bacterium]